MAEEAGEAVIVQVEAAVVDADAGLGAQGSLDFAEFDAEAADLDLVVGTPQALHKAIGIDAGANAGSTFVLVYNLHDTDELYHRYVAGEGAAYLVGGFNASYLRRGDVVLIPIRMGVGARLGVNVGYMKFSRRQRWLPF